MNNLHQCGMANPISPSETATITVFKFRANRFYIKVCQFSKRCSFPFRPSHSFPFYGIHEIVIVSALNNMARIKAGRVVTSVPSYWIWEFSIGQIKSNAVRFILPLLELAKTVASMILRKRPNETIIGVVSGNGFYKPEKLFRIGRHRCSHKASVLGGHAFTSVSPF